MLFSSYEFIFIFLPLVLIITFISVKFCGKNIGIFIILICSIIFYGYWDIIYLILIGFSISINFIIGRILLNKRSRNLLTAGIFINLALLFYFKYTIFIIENFNNIFDRELQIYEIALPLAISFFTFQQIAYLIDLYRGEAADYSFLEYSLFVTFFPQLIAGPIVHHKEMMPQFRKDDALAFKWDHFRAGGLVFLIGLFKKVILADGFATHSDVLFTSEVLDPDFFEAWSGALAYTFQIYFDFSGYSDMALGIAMMFGIKLPLNFLSPYKARNISDFWRCWHITLSRFLRDYLYIPLGGNRKGLPRRYINLAVVMLLGGLWHGAAWTFVAWGALHGLYLVIHQVWQNVVASLPLNVFRGRIWSILSTLLTFISIVIAWVFFRAESFDDAFVILSAMAGFGAVPGNSVNTDPYILAYLAFGFFVVWCLPNAAYWLDVFSKTRNIPLNLPFTWMQMAARNYAAVFFLCLGGLAISIVLYRGDNTVSFVYMIF